MSVKMAEDIIYVGRPSMWSRTPCVDRGKRMWPHVAQTTSECGLSDQISLHPGLVIRQGRLGLNRAFVSLTSLDQGKVQDSNIQSNLGRIRNWPLFIRVDFWNKSEAWATYQMKG